jgi:hypothetical protein
MDNRYHRGYRIKVRSFRAGARWRTEVVIATMKVPIAELTLPFPPVHWSAATEEEANHYGLAMAKDWIARTQE